MSRSLALLSALSLLVAAGAGSGAGVASAARGGADAAARPGAVAAASCRAGSVIGLAPAAGQARLRRAHCRVRVVRIGDMGGGSLRVVAQWVTSEGVRILEVSHRGGRCRFARPYWKVVAQNDIAVVAHTGRDADELWVCVRATGERRQLGRTEDWYPDWDGFVGMRLAGPWLAYAEAHSGRSGASATIVLANLGPQGGTVRFPGPTDAIPKEIAVNEAGDTAWSTDPDPTAFYGPADGGVSVRPLGGSTRPVLVVPVGRMRAEPITGLSIDATTVRWDDAGVPGSAPILPAS